MLNPNISNNNTHLNGPVYEEVHEVNTRPNGVQSKLHEAVKKTQGVLSEVREKKTNLTIVKYGHLIFFLEGRTYSN